MSNIHASCVDYDGKGILLLGASGSGKSGLCLELILNYNAMLVADDRVELTAKAGGVYASAPENIKGLLEVRNVGILRLPVKEETRVQAVVRLEPVTQTLERLPEPESCFLENTGLPLLRFYENDTAVAAKIIAFLSFPRI
ncbi:MAG: HPr kinase/phosphatase C-terminal domain-containing protein [Alphaproteobacteria bacterium]|nr:HPr kinase/phosphatase C-terminal domain-containing protein [Alphaproteobacteria bacterium]